MNDKWYATQRNMLIECQAERLETPNNDKTEWVWGTKTLKMCYVWRIVTMKKYVNQNGRELSSGHDNIKHWKHITKPLVI